MHESRNRHLVRGILAGAGAGLAASWIMNAFMAGPGQKLHEAVESEEEKRQEQIQQKRQAASGEPKQDATMKAADSMVATITGGRHLSMEQREKGGPIVHYGFGAVIGGLYGGLAEYSCTVRRGFGTAFGTALFAGADLVAVPAFKLSSPPSEWPPSSLVNPFAAHLVYGASTELLRRFFRAIL